MQLAVDGRTFQGPNTREPHQKLAASVPWVEIFEPGIQTQAMWFFPVQHDLSEEGARDRPQATRRRKSHYSSPELSSLHGQSEGDRKLEGTNSPQTALWTEPNAQPFRALWASKGLPLLVLEKCEYPSAGPGNIFLISSSIYKLLMAPVGERAV